MEILIRCPECNFDIGATIDQLRWDIFECSQCGKYINLTAYQRMDAALDFIGEIIEKLDKIESKIDASKTS